MKKNISFILIVMLLLSSLGITTFSANTTVECKQTVNSTDLGSAEGEYKVPDKFIYGDVNQDGVVTVKDVTYIQKGLAEIHYVNAVQRFLADPDSTGFSIKNATAIQKYLAQYESETPWGEEIVMASQDEFSGMVENNAQYTGDIILLMFKTEQTIDYSLKDFPEYGFTSIERINEVKPHIYRLKLSNQSKENVIEAIKALDYRANLDLLYVGPNYIMELD